MNSGDSDKLAIDPGLKLTFALLIVLILGGNGLIFWQFHLARLQTERLADVNQQLIGVLRLQVSLLSVHQRLDRLAQSRDAAGLANESEPLREALLEETQGEMSRLTRLPYETHVDPEFQPTLKAIEITLPSQLEAINGLAASGDWKAVRLRLDNELEPVESLCASLVAGTDQEVSGEQALAVANMRKTQLAIFLVVPLTAISTFFVAALLGGAVTRRMITVRAHERVAERTRIARELHDTLLQSFQGAVFQIQAARTMLLRGADNAMAVLDEAILAAEGGITEGRAAIRDLRPEPVAQRNLPQLLEAAGHELAEAQQLNGQSTNFRVIVEGKERILTQSLEDEVFKIAHEVIRNAFQHASASHIEVEIHYDDDQLRLRIRDDGEGIDPKILKAGGQPGHWGIPGLRERAQRIDSRLEFWSEVGAGTEAQLTITAAVAYEKRRHGRRFRLFHLGRQR